MALALLSLLNYACQDDNIGGNERGEVIPGQPATVNLTVNVGNMGIRTRASIANDDAKSSYCQNLWIGIYDASTGNLQDKYYLTDVASTNEAAGTEYPLTLKTESSEGVYIVAVANCDVNSGVSDVSKYGSEKESTLRQLLDKAETFDQFKSICALRPDAKDVNVYANTLTMSGWYATSKPAVGEDIQPVAINAGANDLSGAIYLSRIISYNKFIIQPGENISLTLNSWKVHNIPAGCYLLEHAGTDNAGNNSSDKESFYNESNIDRSFTAIHDTDGNITGHSFEFYQLENKNYATSNISDYNQRKNAAPDNASYLVLNATIDYYYDPKDDPKTAKPVPSTTEGAIHRAAKVDYTIYLGYCENVKDDGTTAISKAYDFNCRRNTKYTYTATVKGVNNIVVDAQKSTDPEPGTEGWVSDDVGGFEELDSHYCEFNICLTDDDRASMRYRVTAPYGNSTYYYELTTDGKHKKTDGMDEELYSWVKFYPTKDKNTLAKYKGGKGLNSLEEAAGQTEGSGLWTLDDLCNPDKMKNPYDADADTEEKWYTVFVDEYVYHIGETKEDNGGYDETTWPNYVNKDDRLVELIMTIDTSNDGKSIYSHCKYAFAQKSIQTYYKGEPNAIVDGVQVATAIGVEHYEETYCLNMNWQFYTGWNGERSESNYDYKNGRYNLYHYLDAKKSNSWANVIQETLPGHVDADESENFQTSHPAADYPVYMPGNKCGKSQNPPSPSDNNAYYANSICMNRNRDLNGDGIIEPNEIRWYLPTSSIYQQIAIAQGELPDPIFRFADYEEDYFQPRTQERNMTYNFHYVTSDYQYFWAEQAVTTGDYPFAGYSGNERYSAAYTVRCIRSLGINQANTPKAGETEAEYAFVHDAKARTFTQSNFTDETLRGYNRGALSPHTLAEPTSRPYKKFEYAENLCKSISGSEISVNGDGTLQWGAYGSSAATKFGAWTRSLESNDICGQYSQTEDGSDLGEWRVPSICEMSLMWIEGLLQADNVFAMSSTHDYFITYDLKDEAENNQAYLGYNNYNDSRRVIAMDILIGGQPAGTIKIRCVRDVKM
jgi:hypothetical protein